MKLYCHACNSVHSFAPSAVERIVYALGAMEHDARLTHAQDRDGMGQCEPSGVVKQNGYVDVEFECYITVLGLAEDSECYLEHVEQARECARA